VRLTNISDGTGEALVPKVILSNMSLENGVLPARTSIKEIQWSIQGFSNVQLYWDRPTDVLAAILATGNGYMEFGALGMSSDVGSGGTGDILLTTVNNIAGATYDITLVVTLS
jgi:hypothetical protein